VTQSKLRRVKFQEIGDVGKEGTDEIEAETTLIFDDSVSASELPI